MLQRIYGTALWTKEELDAYLQRLEEAKKRDHRRLGKELDLFSLHEDVGAGLVLWHPKGGLMRTATRTSGAASTWRTATSWSTRRTSARRTLWETSGHLDFYKENMYSAMEIDGQEYYLKPMNCPFHIRIYKSDDAQLPRPAHALGASGARSIATSAAACCTA